MATTTATAASSEEANLRQQMHLFDLVLQRMLDTEPLPRANVERMLKQAEQVLSSVPEEILQAEWYTDIVVSWAKKLADCRYALWRDSASLQVDAETGPTKESNIPKTDDEIMSEMAEPKPPGAPTNSPPSQWLISLDGEAKHNRKKSAEKEKTEGPTQKAAILLKSKLSPMASEFKPRSSVDTHSSDSGRRLGGTSIASSSSSSPLISKPPVIYAPFYVRYQVCFVLSMFDPVVDATNLFQMNRVFALIANTIRWIFPFLGDDKFHSDIFRLLIAKVPALVQEQFAARKVPHNLRNLLAFMRHFQLGLIMRLRADISKRAHRQPPKGNTRYCGFCKVDTDHNIVICPYRTSSLCHHCFVFGHTVRYCRYPALLPPEWLNQGEIKFDDPLAVI